MTASAESTYVTDLVNAPADWVRKEVTSSFGAIVRGARIRVAIYHKARGTGSRLHQHDNEQFNFVLRGVLVGEIAGKPFRCPKGHVVHIPADTPHTIIADPEDEDAVFFVAKDIEGGRGTVTALEGEEGGPRLEAGFQVSEGMNHNRSFGL